MIVERVCDASTGLNALLAVVRPEDLAFGGTRFSTTCTEAEVVALAEGMEKKLAGHTAAIGGAKAGFFCAPDDPGLPALMRLAAKKWGPLLRERVVLGKDMGASNALMDRFYKQVGQSQLAPVVGPAVPERLRDFTGYRVHMTGQGVCWSLSSFFSGSLNGVRVAIQGFGAVGLGAAVRLTRAGAQVLGVSDVHGAYAFSDAPTESEWVAMAQGGRCVPVNACTRLPREQLFSMEVDAVVLAANSHSVSAQEAESLCAQVLVEGSNFGLCADARALLRDRGQPVIPDFIASSASAAMVALQMEARGTLPEVDLWSRIEESIRTQTQGLNTAG
jgi:glutamate dehydrogenase (NAD(P)+)